MTEAVDVDAALVLEATELIEVDASVTALTVLAEFEVETAACEAVSEPLNAALLVAALTADVVAA